MALEFGDGGVDAGERHDKKQSGSNALQNLRAKAQPYVLGQTTVQEYSYRGYELLHVEGQLSAIRKKMLGKSTSKNHYDLDEIACKLTCSQAGTKGVEEYDLLGKISDIMRNLSASQQKKNKKGGTAAVEAPPARVKNELASTFTPSS